MSDESDLAAKLRELNPLFAPQRVNPDAWPAAEALRRLWVASGQLFRSHESLTRQWELDGPPALEDWPGSARLVRRAERHLQITAEAARNGQMEGPYLEPQWTRRIREWAEEYRTWCAAIEDARTALRDPKLVSMMDAGEARLTERWTVKMRREVDSLLVGLGPGLLGADGLGILRPELRPLPQSFTTSAKAIATRRDELLSIPTATEAARPTGKPRRSGGSGGRVRGLTDIELGTMEVVRRCGNNIAEAARELNRDPKTVHENLKRAQAKLKTITGKSIKARRLPHDERGQAQVEDSSD